MRARASGPVSRRSSMRRVITFNGWLRIDVVMTQWCYNAVFLYIFLSMAFLTCWQIFPDYAAPPCMNGITLCKVFIDTSSDIFRRWPL